MRGMVLKQICGDFPDSPVVRAPYSHCWGPGVQSQVRELRSHYLHGTTKKIKIIKHFFFKKIKNKRNVCSPESCNASVTNFPPLSHTWQAMFTWVMPPCEPVQDWAGGWRLRSAGGTQTRREGRSHKVSGGGWRAAFSKESSRKSTAGVRNWTRWPCLS